MNSPLISTLSALLIAALPFPSALAQSASTALPTITFTKEFPGSNPAYYSIAVRQDGEALYRLAPPDEKPLNKNDKPVEFQISPESTDKIFALAGRLNNFHAAALESKLKVAFMGKKTFLYESGDVREEVSFNHTGNADALALATLFERLSATEQHRDRIEFLIRFDKLGIVKELLQVEIDLDQGRLLEPALLLPALEKVRGNSSLVNVAQTRAAGIIAKLQAGAP